jgi:hypothetical protein
VHVKVGGDLRQRDVDDEQIEAREHDARAHDRRAPVPATRRGPDAGLC